MRFGRMFLFIFIFTLIIKGQNIPEVFSTAMKEYSEGSFVKAYNDFVEIRNNKNFDKRIKTIAAYYAGECLSAIGSLDGAASTFEKFIFENDNSKYKLPALFKLGTIYYDLKLYKKSIHKFKILLNTSYNREYIGSAYYWIGKAYLAEERFSEAEEFLRDAIANKQNNNFVDYTIYALANLYEEIGEYRNAVTYYSKILDYHSNSSLVPYAQMRIGICYFKLKDYDNAILELSDSKIDLLSEKAKNESDLILANSFFRLNEFKNASEVYNKILSKYSTGKKSDLIKYGIAWINFQAKDYTSAYKIFDELSKEAEDSVKINSLYCAAECKRYSGETDGAINIYESFVKKYPEHKLIPKANLNIALILYNENKIAKAQRYLIKSLDANNKSVQARAFTLLGEISLSKKDYQEAKNYFTKALDLKELSEEQNQRSVLGLGVSQYYLSDYKGAIQSLIDLTVKAKQFERAKVNFYLAEAYLQNGKYKLAITHYKRVGVGDKELNRQVILGKAYSYFNNKEFDDAIYYFKKCVAEYNTSPEIVDIKLRLADSYYASKNFNEASRIYREVYNSHKYLLKTDYAYYQYSQSLFQAGRYENAISVLHELQMKFPKSKYAAEAQRLVGWIYFKQNNYQVAINNWKEIFIKYPTSSLRANAYYLIGDSYYNMGNYDTAIAYYNKLIKEFPDKEDIFDAVNGIQYCYLAKDEPEKAITIIDEFVDENRNSQYAEEILLKKGDIYFGLADFQNSLKGYKEYLIKFPKGKYIAKAHIGAAKSATELNQEEEAMNNYFILADKQPTSDEGITASIELAKIYTKNEDYQSALVIYDRAISKNKQSERLSELLYMKALTQIDSNDIDEATKVLEYISNTYGNDVYTSKARIKLGNIELEKNNFSKAENLFLSVSELRTDNLGAESQYCYGLALYKQGKIEDAISALVRVRTVYNTYDQWYSKSLLLLGDCYQKLGNKKEARAMYKAVLKKHKNNILGKEANKKLKEL